MNAALTFALGPVEFRYALDYHDYLGLMRPSSKVTVLA
jgi:hypothetical protein